MVRTGGAGAPATAVGASLAQQRLWGVHPCLCALTKAKLSVASFLLFTCILMSLLTRVCMVVNHHIANVACSIIASHIGVIVCAVCSDICIGWALAGCAVRRPPPTPHRLPQGAQASWVPPPSPARPHRSRANADVPVTSLDLRVFCG